MVTVRLSFENNEAAPIVFKRVLPGETLLELFLSQNANIRHDCGGICHCTTCHIYVESGENFLEEPSKRESDFLQKVANRKPTSRLACQCLTVEGKGVIEVVLPG